MPYPIEISPQNWEKIRACLNQISTSIAGKEEDCYRFICAIAWMTRSGASWRLLPQEYGKWNSVYQCFNRWIKKGVWEKLLSQCQIDPDIENLCIDSTLAHPCASGGEGGTRARSGATPPKFMPPLMVWGILCS